MAQSSGMRRCCLPCITSPLARIPIDDAAHLRAEVADLAPADPRHLEFGVTSEQLVGHGAADLELGEVLPRQGDVDVRIDRSEAGRAAINRTQVESRDYGASEVPEPCVVK